MMHAYISCMADFYSAVINIEASITIITTQCHCNDVQKHANIRMLTMARTGCQEVVDS